MTNDSSIIANLNLTHLCPLFYLLLQIHGDDLLRLLKSLDLQLSSERFQQVLDHPLLQQLPVSRHLSKG